MKLRICIAGLAVMTGLNAVAGGPAAVAPDWRGAKWITGREGAGRSVRLRREFDVKPGLVRGTVFASAPGGYDITLDGGRVGSSSLGSGGNQTKGACQYDDVDLTQQLRKSGRHAVGLLLGNGSIQGVIAELRLQYADGSVEEIPTGTQWRASAGPITWPAADGGEWYDARLDAPGWDMPGFADAKWERAVAVDGFGTPAGQRPLEMPGRGAGPLRAVPEGTIGPGVRVYDFGRLVTIKPWVTVSGGAGAAVIITPGDALAKDGAVEPGGPACWMYTLNGALGESYLAKFFFHRCRYLEIRRTAPAGSRELPLVLSVQGVVVPGGK